MIITIDGPAGAGQEQRGPGLGPPAGLPLSRHGGHVSGGGPGRHVAAASIGSGRRNWPSSPGDSTSAWPKTASTSTARNITEAIRRTEVTAVTRYAADNLGVRGHMVKLQRAIAGTDNLVSEGRDQGTVVFPAAECKFFLTASEDERARRRLRDLEARGEAGLAWRKSWPPSGSATGKMPAGRWGPCELPPDAIRVSTDGLTPDQVVDRLESLARTRYSGSF